MNTRHSTSQSGLTMIELAIVLAIIGLIASTLIPTLTSTVKRGKMSEARSVLYAVRDEIIGYAECPEHELPETLEAIGIPKDPWGRAIRYRLPGSLNGTNICNAAPSNEMPVITTGNETLNATAFVLSSDGPDHSCGVGNMSPESGVVNASNVGDDLFLYVSLYHLQAAVCPPFSGEGTPSNPLTSLGSTFSEISSAMIELIQGFYDENGVYPRTWGDFQYTDIGLDPEEWSQGYDGIIYKPVGNRIQITPENGYTFYVTDLNGVERELSANLNWSLMYSMNDNSWYYHSIEVENELDISTLQVVMD